MNARPISEVFQYLHTYFRDIMEIHKDNKQLDYCFVNKFMRSFDENSVASYAFNLPSISFIKSNQVFKDIAIEAAEHFSSVQNINPVFFYAFVGQGKTTYLKHLINIRINNDPAFAALKKKTYFIYLPYTKDDSQCSKIETDLYSEITTTIKRILDEHNFDIRKDYNLLCEIFPADQIEFEYVNDIGKPEEFFKYIVTRRTDYKEFNRNITRWLLNKKKIKICCIVDNIDQHFKFFDDSNYTIFTKFFQTVMSYDIQPIIPLRISNKGFQGLSFFEAYHSIPIHLGLPDFGEVLEKRIKYIENYFVSELKSPIWLMEDGTILNNSELFEIFNSIAGLINQNESVKHSLYMLSNNITREYLRIMINIFSSQPLFYNPLTNEKINYNLRIDQERFHSLFIYALMLRNNEFHQESDDEIPIVNLFNNQTNNNWNSFLRFHLLYYLNDQVVTNIHITQFIDNFLKEYRIDRKSVKTAIASLAKKKCLGIASENEIETLNIGELVSQETCFISIALRGKFHLELSKELEYYEILALPRLFNEKKDLRALSSTYMTERGDNLLSFLESLKKDEEHLKGIYSNEKNYESHLFWSNKYYPNLMKEWSKIFKKNKL